MGSVNGSGPAATVGTTAVAPVAGTAVAGADVGEGAVCGAHAASIAPAELKPSQRKNSRRVIEIVFTASSPLARFCLLKLRVEK
jgi:hypothetical protein